MNPYHDFSAPIEKHGWEAFNQSVGGLGDAINAHFKQQETNKDAIKLLMLKNQLETENAGNVEKVKKQAEFDMQGQQFERGKKWQAENPAMFGGIANPVSQTNNIPQVPGGASSSVASTSMGSAFNPVSRQAESSEPSSFTTVTDPMTGKMKQVVNPKYQLYRSQEMAKLKSKLQPESADAASAITYRDSLTKSIKEIKDIVQKPDFDWGSFGAWRVSQDNPSFTTFGRNMNDPKSQDMVKVHNALQFIKKSAFGEAGKTLTDTEKNLVYSVLQPQGQPIKDWTKNLDKSLAILTERANLLARNKDNVDSAIASTEVDSGLDKQVNDLLDQLGVE